MSIPWFNMLLKGCPAIRFGRPQVSTNLTCCSSKIVVFDLPDSVNIRSKGAVLLSYTPASFPRPAAVALPHPQYAHCSSACLKTNYLHLFVTGSLSFGTPMRCSPAVSLQLTCLNIKPKSTAT
jgi:hypothetical protein